MYSILKIFEKMQLLSAMEKSIGNCILKIPNKCTHIQQGCSVVVYQLILFFFLFWLCSWL